MACPLEALHAREPSPRPKLVQLDRHLPYSREGRRIRTSGSLNRHIEPDSIVDFSGALGVNVMPATVFELQGSVGPQDPPQPNVVLNTAQGSLPGLLIQE